MTTRRRNLAGWILASLTFITGGCASPPETREAAVPPTGESLFLPFAEGESFACWQGIEQGPTHNTAANRYAIDFSPMAIGTKIYAASDGTVLFVKEDADGPTGNAADNNEIAIRMADGNVVQYLHLKRDGAIVEVGDQVLAGDLIGYSGNTGNSMAPHLHIAIREHTRSGRSKKFRFADVPGDGVPVRGESYRSGNLAIRTLLRLPLLGSEVLTFGDSLGARSVIKDRLMAIDPNVLSPDVEKAATRTGRLSELRKRWSIAVSSLHQRLRLAPPADSEAEWNRCDRGEREAAADALHSELLVIESGPMRSSSTLASPWQPAIRRYEAALLIARNPWLREKLDGRLAFHRRRSP